MNLSFKNKLSVFTYILLFVFSTTISFSNIQAAQGVPTVLSYQGKLTDSGGNPLGGGGTNYYFKFSIWDNPTPGSGTKLWPSTSPTATQLTVRQGTFSVDIGDDTYPDALNYNFNTNSKIYLQVEVSGDGITYETLAPRSAISSSAFSQVANSINGTADSSFGTTTPFANTLISALSTAVNKAVMTIKGAVGQVANLFNVLDSNNNSLFTVTAGGNVGVGTSTPFDALTIFDNNKYITLGGLGCSTGYVGINFNSSPNCSNYSFLGDGLSTFFNANAGGAMYFRIANTTKALIDSSGNVGIGTTTPSAKLDVWGNFNVGTSSNPALFVNTANSSVGIGMTPTKALSIKSQNTSDGLEVYSSTNAEAEAFLGLSAARVGVLSLRNAGSTKINLNANSTSTINTGYGLAIGTTTATTMLDVWGNFNVGTSSTPALFVNTANNKVGIGTNSPNYTLHVTDPTASAIRNVSGTRILQLASYAGDTNYLDSTGSTLRIRTTDAQSIQFYTNNAFAGTIDSAGRFGIGTGVPGTRLSVLDTTTNSTGIANVITLGLNSSSANPVSDGFGSSIYGNLEAADGIMYGSGNINNYWVNATTKTSAWSIGTRVGTVATFNDTGLGLGVTTPNAKLDINGGGSGINTAFNALRLGTGQSVSGTDYTSSRIIFESTTGNEGSYIEGLRVGTNENHLAFYTKSGSGVVIPTEKLRITSTGDVGIGTTTPIAKLDVNGNINIPNSSLTAGAIYQNGVRLLHTYGTSNTFFGAGAGNFTTTGFSNVGIGTGALSSLGLNASFNFGLGNNAGSAITTGQSNVLIGNSVGTGITSGTGNTIVGDAAGLQNGNSSNSVFIGRGAGRQIGPFSNSIFIGWNAGGAADGGQQSSRTLSNAIAIGMNSYVDANNTMVLGGTGSNAVDIVSGSSTAFAKLHLIKTTEQLRLGYDNANYLSTTVGSTGLSTFNAMGTNPAFAFTGGNVGIGTTTPSARLSIGINTTLGYLNLGKTDSGSATLFNEIYGPTSPTAGGTLLLVQSNGTMGNGGSIFRAVTSGGVGLRISESGKMFAPGNASFSSAGPATLDFGGGNNTNTFTTFNSGSHSATDFLFKAGTADRTAGNLFQIANYTAPVLTVNAVTGGGNVGIGTTTPTQKLSVVGNAQFTGVTSGTYAFDLNLTSDGTLTTSASDINLKENIMLIDATSTLDKLMQLRPSEFDWKSNKSHDVGLIAQEVEQIFPELVFTNPTDGYKGVNYSRFITLLISAVQELTNKISGFAKEFRTEKLCVGDTCITESQLKVLLQNQGVTYTAPTPTVVSDNENTNATTTEVTSTSTGAVVSDTTTETVVPDSTVITESSIQESTNIVTE